MFYLVGQDQSNKTWRVLKVDRSKPTMLKVVEDSTPYAEVECVVDLLQRICDKDKATGGLKHVAKCYGIVGFVKFLGPYYMLLITGSRPMGTICCHDVYSVTESKIILIPAPNVLPNVANSEDEKRYLTRFCSVDLSKDFFFSYSYNLAQTLQSNITEKNAFESGSDTTYVWNEFLTNGFWEQTENPIWNVALVHGFFGQECLRFPDKVSGSVKDFLLTIIARRSRNFAGPRFLNRGVNRDGMVANDVEVEQILVEKTQDGNSPRMTSVVQRRGSIPLSWSHETTKCPVKPDISLKRDDNYNMTRLHFENLKTRYEGPIVILNLIKSFEKKPRESLLRFEFEKAIEHINDGLSTDNHILFVHMDMKKFSQSHEVLPLLVYIGSKVLRQTGILHCGITPASNSDNARVTQIVPISLQKGVLRTNCLDCLDRTNIAQFAYGLASLSHQLYELGLIDTHEVAINDNLSHILMNLYEQMGDALSMQYTGSAALNKVFWKQRGQCGVISLAQAFFRSIQRFVNNAFMDREKQYALDLFLGYSQPQQGMLSVPNIYGNEVTPNNEEHKSGNSSTTQESYSVHEGQNGLSELKKPDLFYSNFLNLDGLSHTGPLMNSHVAAANGHSTEFQ